MNIVKKYRSVNLILRISIGLCVGIVFAVIMNLAISQPDEECVDFIYYNIYPIFSTLFQILGNLFIGALRAIAPVLIFFLISSSLMNAKTVNSRTVRNTVVLYVFGTFFSALMAVVININWGVALVLPTGVNTSSVPESSNMNDVIITIFNSIVANPIEAIANTKFLGVLFWAILFGIVAKPIANARIKDGFKNISDILTEIVKIVIDFAPFGICGLVFTAVADRGIEIITDYGFLLCVYLACTFSMFFIFNPLIVFCVLRKNPYPLVFRTLTDVALTAFFVRSSAANIPMNLKLCRHLGLEKKHYEITIALGSTINMEGAAITIITLTLACCRALGVDIQFGPALILSIVATISAVGASGVSGGSILLVPIACSLFGLNADIASSVVAVGFIIGVVQDSVETALNSSTDGLFTAAVQLREQIKSGKEYHKIVGGTLDDQ